MGNFFSFCQHQNVTFWMLQKVASLIIFREKMLKQSPHQLCSWKWIGLSWVCLLTEYDYVVELLLLCMIRWILSHVKWISTSSVEQCFKKRMCPISHKWFKMFIKMKPDVFLPTWLTEIFFHFFSSSYCLRLRRPDCSRASCNSHGEVGRILDFSRLLMIRWITNIPICSTRPIKATLQFCDDVRIPDKAFLYFMSFLFFAEKMPTFLRSKQQ